MNFRCNGMTLAELLVALMVTSILLAAVTTLTFALDSANDDAEGLGESQARIRYTTLKTAELIKHCLLICAYYNNELVIWKSDDDGDEKIDYQELLFINIGSNDCIKFKTYLDMPNTYGIFDDLYASDFTNGWAQYYLNRDCKKSEVNVVPQCSDVQIRFDSPELPAWERKFVSILFNVTENGESHQYQINARLRACAENLINSSGARITDDD